MLRYKTNICLEFVNHRTDLSLLETEMYKAVLFLSRMFTEFCYLLLILVQLDFVLVRAFCVQVLIRTKYF